MSKGRAEAPARSGGPPAGAGAAEKAGTGSAGSTTPQQVSAPGALPEVPAWRMYRAMVGIGLVCGLLIVSAFQVTAPIIAKNRAEALREAVFEVLPNARSSRIFVRNGEAFAPLPDDGSGPSAGSERIFAGYAEDGSLVGVALEAQAMGYADVIRILYGYSFDKQAIVGMKVLESKETPGLGDKIEKDPKFRENFAQLDVTLEGKALAHPIVLVPHGTKASPWQIDAITGATISSKAITKMLAESTTAWIPLLAPRRADFEVQR